jgi:hypothetical protein
MPSSNTLLLRICYNTILLPCAATPFAYAAAAAVATTTTCNNHNLLRCAATPCGYCCCCYLLLQPPYTYSTAKRQAALQQLQWVEASLARGAALARLRALLLQQGQLQHWQQQAAAAAAQGTPGTVLTPEQAYLEAWKQQQQQQQQQQQELQDVAAAAPLCKGKPLLTSFHSRTASSPWLLQSSPGSVSTAAAAAAGPEGSAAGEVQQLCVVIDGLTQQVRQLKQQLVGGREAALGVLPEVQRWARFYYHQSITGNCSN